MNDALGELEFLVRSKRRVEILQRLASAPCLRYELHAELGVTQSTLGRVLGDFQERAWIRREANVYELTLLGELLADELASMLTTVDVIQGLRDVVECLPFTEMDFDLQCLKGATVTTANADGVNVVVGRIKEKLQMADRLRIITHIGYGMSLEDHRQAVVDEGQELEAVFTRPVLDAILADSAQSRLLAEILESGRAEVYSFDGTFPYVMGIRDGRYVGIVAVDSRGIPLGLVQTDDESVRKWVENTIDQYRHRATPITASMISRQVT